MLTVCHEDLLRDIVGWTEVGTLLFLRASRERMWEPGAQVEKVLGEKWKMDMNPHTRPPGPGPLSRWSLYTTDVPFVCC